MHKTSGFKNRSAHWAREREYEFKNLGSSFSFVLFYLAWNTRIRNHFAFGWRWSIYQRVSIFPRFYIKIIQSFPPFFLEHSAHACQEYLAEWVTVKLVGWWDGNLFQHWFTSTTTTNEQHSTSNQWFALRCNCIGQPLLTGSREARSFSSFLFSVPETSGSATNHHHHGRNWIIILTRWNVYHKLVMSARGGGGLELGGKPRDSSSFHSIRRVTYMGTMDNASRLVPGMDASHSNQLIHAREYANSTLLKPRLIIALFRHWLWFEWIYSVHGNWIIWEVHPRISFVVMDHTIGCS